VDAVESEFGDGGTPALCPPSAGRGGPTRTMDGQIPLAARQNGSPTDM